MQMHTATRFVGIFSLIFSTLLMTSMAPARAHEQAVAVDYLIGEGDLTGIRLAYRPYHHTIDTFDWLGELDVYWEVSFNFWEFGEDNSHESNIAFALSPVFSKQFATLYDKYPLRWEFGIGVSLVEDTRFAGKDIGSHYQFEDRLGLIMQFGDKLDQSVSVRYMHYSNGGLNDDNPGMDFLSFSWAYKF